MKVSHFKYLSISILIVISIYQQGIQRLIPQLKFLDDFILFLILAIFIFDRRMKINIKVKWFNNFFIIIILLMLISVLLNQSSLSNLILSMKYYLFGFIFFYLVVSNENLNTDKILNIYKWALLLQFPIILVQLYNSYKLGNLSVDTLRGSFSGSNTMSYAVFYLLFYLTYLISHGIKIN
jgi:hypothetical protein